MDNLAYQLYLLDYSRIYYIHDNSPADQNKIMNHYYKHKGSLYHEHDSIDEYYEKAKIILRKEKLEELNDNRRNSI